MAKHSFPFSRRALFLTPLVIAAPAAVLFVGGSNYPIVTFGLGALVGYLLTLAAVGGLLIPALWLMSRLTTIKRWIALVVGGFLAVPIFVAWDYTNWSSSGVDSGPPAMTYRQWIAKNWLNPEPLVVVFFGIVTAAVYHFLATRKPNPSSRSLNEQEI